MSRIAEKPGSLNSWAMDLAEPFAKALATFVREAVDAGVAGEALLEKLRSSESLNRAGKKHISELVKKNQRLEKAGKLERLRFEDIPEPKPTLRDFARLKGVTQKELAEKTGMDAAMVSRVLKNPDRSKVSTVRRIARALGVGLGDLNLDEVAE